MRIAAVAALVVVSAAYALLIAMNVSHAAGGPDESGYMNEARLLASGRARVDIEPLRTLKIDRSFAMTFTPQGFAPRGRTIVPTYPPGYPMHLALAAMIGGWNIAPFVIAPLCGLIALLLTFLLARELGLAFGYALGATAIVAAFPTFIMQSIQVMSDVPATMWALAAILLALRSSRNPHLAFAAGAAFGVAVAVRPTNVLLAIPLAIALPRTNLWRAIAGAVPFAIALMVFNDVVYGGPFVTGYGSALHIVSLGSMAPCLGEQSMSMLKLLTPIIFPGGLLVMFDRRVGRRHRALLVSWFAIFLAYYALWPVCDAWWYTRFLLPATAPLVIGAMFLLRDLMPRRVAIATLIVVALVFYEARQARHLDVFDLDETQQVYPGSVRTAERLFPRNAIVVSGLLSGAFRNYADRWTVRYETLDADRFALLRAYAAGADLQWYAVLSDVEVDMNEFVKRMPGKWTPIGRFRDVTVYRLDS